MTDEIREEISSEEPADNPREARTATRSALTRWLAQRQAKQAPVGMPSYERCQERQCWGKATWVCPNCKMKSCSAHRPDHSCKLPYLPPKS